MWVVREPEVFNTLNHTAHRARAVLGRIISSAVSIDIIACKIGLENSLVGGSAAQRFA